jgi:hypothetical protein
MPLLLLLPLVVAREQSETIELEESAAQVKSPNFAA